jgi:hypothetical protein
MEKSKLVEIAIIGKGAKSFLLYRYKKVAKIAIAFH